MMGLPKSNSITNILSLYSTGRRKAANQTDLEYKILSKKANWKSIFLSDQGPISQVQSCLNKHTQSVLLLVTRPKTQQVVLLKLQKHQPARTVKHPEELSRTQDGLNRLEKWSKPSKIKFNTAKYKESCLDFKRNLQMHKTIKSRNARLAAVQQKRMSKLQ